MAEAAHALTCKEVGWRDTPDSKASSQDEFRLEESSALETCLETILMGLGANTGELRDELSRLRKQELSFMPVLSSWGWSISVEDRATMIGCISRVCAACRLRFETHMLAMNFFDRYTASLSERCHDSPALLALACITLAAKMEENNFHPFRIAPVLACFHKSLDMKELAATEAVIVKSLEWRTSGPTVASIFDTLIHLLAAPLQALTSVHINGIRAYSQELCSVAMQDASFACLRPSHLALAVVRSALLHHGLQDEPLDKLMAPAESIFADDELMIVNEVQMCMIDLIQTSARCSSPKTAREEVCYQTTPVEESPTKKRKCGQATPKSTLALIASPLSDIDSMSCTESPESLL